MFALDATPPPQAMVFRHKTPIVCQEGLMVLLRNRYGEAKVQEWTDEKGLLWALWRGEKSWSLTFEGRGLVCLYGSG